MDQLWAPWRLAYVENPPKPVTAGPDCFICRGLAEDADRQNHIVRRTPLSVALLNRFPYNNGHLLIAPQAHKSDLRDLTSEEVLDTQATIARLIAVIEKSMKAEGFNVGLNLGKVAGAGLPGHLHWHVVPRWPGDVNFMTVLTDTKVIVQSLDSLWELLTRELG